MRRGRAKQLVRFKTEQDREERQRYGLDPNPSSCAMRNISKHVKTSASSTLLCDCESSKLLFLSFSISCVSFVLNTNNPVGKTQDLETPAATNFIQINEADLQAAASDKSPGKNSADATADIGAPKNPEKIIFGDAMDTVQGTKTPTVVKVEDAELAANTKGREEVLNCRNGSTFWSFPIRKQGMNVHH